LLQSSSELPADLKQDQQEFNEKHAINNVVRRLNLWIRRLFEEKSLIVAKELLTSIKRMKLYITPRSNKKLFNFNG
jgi:hypothetical protein